VVARLNIALKQEKVTFKDSLAQNVTLFIIFGIATVEENLNKSIDN